MIICFCIAALLAIYGVAVLSLGTGTGFGLAWLLLSAMSVLVGIFIRKGLWHSLPHIFRCITAVFLAACLVVFIGFQCCLVSKMHEKAPSGLDYLIVLGAQVYKSGPSVVLKYRLDAASEYLKSNPDTVCIVSGGQGSNEPFAEAVGMAAYLEKHGISAERIIKEDKSKTTEENLKNSMKYIEKGSSVGIVTNNFHIFRASQIAESAGLEDFSAIAAKSTALFLPNNMLREFFAEIKFILRAVL